MGEPARILVVDDDEGIRDGLETVLEEEGYVVDTAEDGEQAIERSQSNFYNLALIDIRLPDMPGTRLLTAMRDTTPKMIKIIVTGYPSLENAVEAVNRGADGYTLKPLDIPTLLQKISHHLKRQQETQKYSEEKVAEFIQTRVRELEAERAEVDRATKVEKSI